MVENFSNSGGSLPGKLIQKKILSGMFSWEFYKAIFQNTLKCNFCLYFMFLNPFQVSVLFVYPLKSSEHLLFSDVFRGYTNETLA